MFVKHIIKSLHVSLTNVWPSSGGRPSCLVLLLLLCLFASSSCLFGMWLYVVYVRACLMYLSVGCLVVWQFTGGLTSAASARFLFDRDDAVLRNTVRRPSRRGHRSLPAAAARFLCGQTLSCSKHVEDNVIELNHQWKKNFCCQLYCCSGIFLVILQSFPYYRIIIRDLCCSFVYLFIV